MIRYMYAMSRKNIISTAISKNSSVCQVKVMKVKVSGLKFRDRSHPLTARPIKIGHTIRFGLKLFTIFSTGFLIGSQR